MVGLILGMVSWLGAQTGSLAEAPATIILRIPGPGPGHKPAVTFNHRRHEAGRLACTQCHHDYQGRRNVWRQGLPVDKCQACHGLRPEPRRLDLKNAFHRQCKGCHLKLEQQGRRAGPIDCRDCHRRS